MRLRKLVRDDEMLDRTQAERAGDLVLRPFQQFARRQASGSLLLLVALADDLFARLSGREPSRLQRSANEAGHAE